MVTIARPRFWPVLLLLTAIMLVHPASARADRIDITNPTLLGPVLVRVDNGQPEIDSVGSAKSAFWTGSTGTSTGFSRAGSMRRGY